MRLSFTQQYELLQRLKNNESSLGLLSTLERLGCKIPPGQESYDIYQILKDNNREDVIQKLEEAGLLND